MSNLESKGEAWNNQLANSEQLVPLVGQLFRERRVALNIYGSPLVNVSAIEILKAHRYARQVTGRELDARRTLELTRAILASTCESANLDLGQLLQELGDSYSVDALTAALGVTVEQKNQVPFRDVVLYGFGRIGRLVARILISEVGSKSGLRLKAVVVRRGSTADLTKRASLLRRDSVHGKFAGVIKVDDENEALIINGTKVQFIYANDPKQIDYAAFGIENALLIDNTGIWRDVEGLSQHLTSKAIDKVLLTAPGKGALKNIVYGINHDMVSSEDQIVTAASCTTNAITPVLKVLSDTYGIVHGHVETVHSYTNDQNLIDNFHKGERRGRSAPMNMVITETGAAKAVAKALPELAGKLTGNAIRVPTPNVSLAILNIQLESEVGKAEINELLRSASISSNLHDQIDYQDSPEVVSTDFVGSSRAGIVDGLATIAEGRNAVIYVWYDNEFGYSNQVIRLAKLMAGVQLVNIPDCYPR